jgi:glycosyltransferase involved in cell wall biosynthesis
MPSHREAPQSSSVRPDADRPGPQVTVVVAAYNAERFLRQTIESVLAQSLANIEVIVIDDGSTDRTREILQRFSDPRLVMS